MSTVEQTSSQTTISQPATFSEPELLGDYRTFTNADRS
jgi:hypothetical protein